MQLDKAKGRATGTLGKGELGDALKAFFRVGQPGGKTEERHDELMQVPSFCTPLSASFCLHVFLAPFCLCCIRPVLYISAAPADAFLANSCKLACQCRLLGYSIDKLT